MQNKDAFDELASVAGRIVQREKGSWRERMLGDLYRNADEIAEAVVRRERLTGCDWQRRADDVILSRRYGYPLMMLLLAVVLWLTIVGANIPAAWLADGLFALLDSLSALLTWGGVPIWVHDIVVHGMAQCLAWVIAVMLLPMVIFFLLFTLLEDIGYLPRIALCLDRLFYRSCACGKQALTMCMGLGCNAAGVVACRIIDSPRERILAMITNSFVPCNGRFPTILLLAALFVGTMTIGNGSSLQIACMVTGGVLLGVAMTFAVTWMLAKTLLRGEPSTMILELPPYRMPNMRAVLYRSLWERTRFVLWRAVVVAMPAGVVIWMLAHVSVGEVSLLIWLAQILEPVAWYLGLDGAILLAFLLGMPANEIVLPILMMIYLQSGQMAEVERVAEIGEILTCHGWTVLTLVNTAIFTLFHWPCATTLLSVYQESHRTKWAILAAILPTGAGCMVCFVIAGIMRGLGIV